MLVCVNDFDTYQKGSPDLRLKPGWGTIFVVQNRDLTIPGEHKLVEDLRRD